MKFYLPTKINFGIGSINSLNIIQNRVMVLISQSIAQNNNIRKSIESYFEQKNIDYHFYEKVGGEPSTEVIDNIAYETQGDFDAVLGIGGGSTLDIAKFIALLKVSDGVSTDYEFGQREIRGALPTYLVPTTSGSGSEVTPYAVASNSKTNRKFTITHQALYPVESFIDPLLTIKLTRYYTLATAIDAFIHSLEALLNTKSNPLIQPLAIKGLQLIYNHLDLAIKNPNDVSLREKISLASLIGGISISQSRTGLIHTLSVAFSEFIDEPHGILAVKMLSYAIRYNSDYYKGKLAYIVSQMICKKVNTDYDAYKVIISWVKGIFEKENMEIPQKNLLRSNVDHIIHRVLQDKGLPEVNDKEINKDSINSLISEIVG